MFNENKVINVEEVFNFSIDNVEKRQDLIKVCKALSHDLRLNILNQLLKKPSTITQLSKINNIDNSTLLFHLEILENAKLIFCRSKPSSKGKALVFYINFEFVQISVKTANEVIKNEEVQSIGVGNYSEGSFNKYMRIISNNDSIVLKDNDVYNPLRFTSDLISIDSGYVVYDFSNKICKNHKIESIEFSLEICSESPYYCNDWKSELSFYVNNVLILKYISPGDFGDKRGKLNPDWWDDKYSQYGRLINIKITNENILLNGEKIKQGNFLDNLKLNEGNNLSFKISSNDAEKYDGGFNIFGKNFGDYPQDIKMTIKYSE